MPRMRDIVGSRNNKLKKLRGDDAAAIIGGQQNRDRIIAVPSFSFIIVAETDRGR